MLREEAMNLREQVEALETAASEGAKAVRELRGIRDELQARERRIAQLMPQIDSLRKQLADEQARASREQAAAG